MPELEYLLHLWKRKPENLADPNKDYWRVHVTKAHAIPRIGDAIESEGFDTYSQYRVFEVKHEVNGIADLVTQGREELKERTPHNGERGLVWVLAYREQV